MKYRILFAKKVTSRQYENLTFSFEVESDDGDTPIDYVKSLVVEKVNGWIDEELIGMGLPPLAESRQSRPKESFLDMSDEPAYRRRIC
jgi:hypothetical protein